ncbi:MAG: ATP synthase F1 subunit epsilon [Alphaproteobacteria bacterium]|nr:ATP synthase F1 subunit epsilon [Alphaproteobacteria bacterium]
MTDKITFDLVTPERLLLSEGAEMVTIPGREGDMGVMSGHMPLISTLRPGTIVVSGGDKGDGTYFVAGGFAEVTGAKLTVLAEDAVNLSELDAAGVDARLAIAEKDLSQARNDGDRARAQELIDLLRNVRAQA